MHRFVRLPGGFFQMGSDVAYPEEAPRHRRAVSAFHISAAPVTNLEFGRFVVATGYKTVAERQLDDDIARGLPRMLRVAGSTVFTPPVDGDTCDEGAWWSFVAGACWHAPLGPSSSILDKPDHPVVHIALPDALAYCDWAGVRLPSETEWEFAARSGRNSTTEFAWGDEREPEGIQMANYWRGEFPSRPAGDNVGGTSSVGSFPPNEIGLVDMIGNVWEWTSTEFTDHHEVESCCGGSKPLDPLRQGGRMMTLKGGSHLCAENYCSRYRPSARIPQPEYYAASHIGFRVASDDKKG